MTYIKKASSHFEKLLESSLKRLEYIKSQGDFVDYSKLDSIKIGVCDGDGIGPTIMASAKAVLNFLLKEEIYSNKVKIKNIEGFTIENRARCNNTLPDYVLEDIKSCNVILKGPTTTPRLGDSYPMLESANVALRKELDLFANVRPVKIKEKNIDWVFFRENTEGAYTFGSCGVNVSDELAVDFTITTNLGSYRIAKLAFEYAKKTGRKKVSIITKANIIKKTDGKFLNICKEVAKEYKNIDVDDWYVDIAAAKLVDEQSSKDFSVLILPNLYGDILTDEAAQIQGGVGTAGSANIGKKYAMFEAIHGSAPKMVQAGLCSYANPTSILRAVVFMLNHIGLLSSAKKLEQTLDICTDLNSKIKVTGFKDGATTEEFTEYVLDTLQKINIS